MVASSAKIAVYITKALKALSSLGTTLSRNILTLWKIVRITTKIAKLGFKGFTLAGSQVGENQLIICNDLQITWLRLLPFLPPVVVGLHVLFSAFWPQRILFYSTSQRRNFISGQLWHWVQVCIQLLSSPRAESARYVTGRWCPHSGDGEDFLTGQLFFFTKTGVTRERKVAK